MRAHLRYKAAEEARKANNDAIRHRKLAETPITLADINNSPRMDLQVELSRLERLEQQTIGMWTESLNS